jgi:hypothetical protein
MDTDPVLAYLDAVEAVLSTVEEKRVVRDAAYWGAPVGTPLPLPKKAQRHKCINVLDEFDLEDKKVQHHINEVATVPKPILDAYYKNGGRIELFTGPVTAHPDMEPYRNVRPRGWDSGSTWDDVIACGPHNRDSDVNAVYVGTEGQGGVTSVLMHELGHGLDVYLSSDGSRLSESPVLKRAYSHVLWYDPYYQQYGQAGRSEAFAEAFATLSTGKYYDDFDSAEGRMYVAAVAKVIEEETAKTLGAKA